ncbi:hypothetical protein [Litorihabitans aurantiacus]|uniref:Uncharacterized protein n=1 Tax=Litorihabitans aurantiacus TaxID=1930061 RepID=A0AA37XF10_9MICO|nr:hypothetical protein [Litorihabitans aurantiacus]GMA31785.1 hypothetical protein GCM10025875_17770 [Litorihabitans aurantiacus]
MAGRRRPRAGRERGSRRRGGRRPLPAGRVDTSALRLTSVPDAGSLVRGLDAAAYAWEVLAARSDDEAFRTDGNARAGELRRTSALLAARTSGGDPREAAYDVGALLDADPVASAAAIEVDVATLWIAADLPAPARAVGLDAALEALLRARALAGVGPLDAPAAVLPGLPVDDGS